MVVVLLIFGAVACINMMLRASSAQFQLLDQLATSIEQNPTKWEGIEIGGTWPLLFHKNLWIASSLMRRFTTWSVVLFSLLIFLLLATLLYERRKTDKQIKE